MTLQPRQSLSSALDKQLEEAAAVLRRGGVVAYPTDTLYGLGADAFNEAAVERVFIIKGRPHGMPLPLLLADPADIDRVAASVPPLARVLAAEFWPGGLTLVLQRAERVPELVAGRGWKIGLRVPDHIVPRELARRLGNPITGTSANKSGGPETRTAAEVRAQLNGEVDLVVEGGPEPTGRSSTVLDLTGPQPRILRQGAVSKERLEAVCQRSL
jgi:L-threonylcarbamoyladenylate synthase